MKVFVRNLRLGTPNPHPFRLGSVPISHELNQTHLWLWADINRNPLMLFSVQVVMVFFEYDVALA
jgi:hypothetical protein